jgi:hypothetical protein
MVAEVFAGLSALKAAFDITKGLKDIDDATRRNAAVIELQEKILSAQAAQAELVEIVGELKKRVTELEDWGTERQRYGLTDVGLGSLAYTLKESIRGTELPHSLCPNCYQRGQKSILQPRTSGHGKELFCPHCKTTLLIKNLDVSMALRRS